MRSLVKTASIENAIFLIRGEKVMLDADLAYLYGVETKVLIQAVKRNIKRFPKDFMFQLTKDEFRILRSQFVTSSWGGRRYLPYVFTEHGVVMLASVLDSERAIQTSIQITKAFIKLRQILATHVELRRKIEEMEKKYDNQFQLVFKAIKQLLEPPVSETKRKIGFISDKKAKYQR